MFLPQCQMLVHVTEAGIDNRYVETYTWPAAVIMICINRWFLVFVSIQAIIRPGPRTGEGTKKTGARKSVSGMSGSVAALQYRPIKGKKN